MSKIIDILKDNLFFKHSRHANTNYIGTDYISASKYPKQNKDLLNKHIYLKVRDHYRLNRFDDSKVKVNRPADDTKFIKSSRGPEDIDTPDIITVTFRVLRADLVEPYILIAVSEDYNIIAISSSKLINTHEYAFNSDIVEYPMQQKDLLSYTCLSEYSDGTLNSYPIRVDDGEPAETIYMESLSNGYVRFTTGEETNTKVIKESISNKGINEIRRSVLGGKKIYG